MVDGIVCIPGTFTGFRRDAALAIGGFVEGMYGEDLDFTLAIARTGYHAAIDTRVRSYEDVPNTQRQLRIQRTRWNRGATMAFARYIPAATGSRRLPILVLHDAVVVQTVPRPVAHNGAGLRDDLAVLDPTSHLNLARVLFLLLFREVPALVQLIGCTVYYGKAAGSAGSRFATRFIMLKHYYGLEAFLGFNARPVVTDRVREALYPASRPAGRCAIISELTES